MLLSWQLHMLLQQHVCLLIITKDRTNDLQGLNIIFLNIKLFLVISFNNYIPICVLLTLLTIQMC